MAQLVELSPLVSEIYSLNADLQSLNIFSPNRMNWKGMRLRKKYRLRMTHFEKEINKMLWPPILGCRCKHIKVDRV